MKRENLKDMGLEKDQIDQIMKMNGEDINSYKGQSSQIDELTKTNDDLTNQLSQRDQDIKDLKKNAGDNNELKSQFEDLQNKYKEAGKQHESELHNLKVDNALNSTLSSYKARDNKAVKALLDRDKIGLDKEGNLTGVNDQLDGLSKEKSFLFDQGQNTNYKPTGASETGQSQETQMAKAFGFDPSSDSK